MSWSLTIHGADSLPSTVSATNPITGTSLTEDLDDMTNYASVTLNYYGAEIGLELEGDEIEYFSGLIEGKRDLRLTINAEMESISHPSSSTTYSTLLTIIPVLKLKYKWVSFDLTNDKIAFHGANEALLVSIDIQTEYDKELGKMKYNLIMKKGLNE